MESNGKKLGEDASKIKNNESFFILPEEQDAQQCKN
jgi:hypothetical protein